VGSYFAGFKGIFTNRSATACLVGAFLSFAGWQVLYFYGASLFRERFGLSVGGASLYFIGGAICFAVGSQLGGRAINRLGRKPLTVGATFLAAIFTISFTNISHLWASIVLAYLGYILYAVMLTAASSLTLEQVPQFRGSMMSIQRAAWSGGAALGISVGGLMLLRFDYNGMGLVVGAFGLVAVVIYHILVRDPVISEQN
jgi:predicted MFS family arabinose efflux permease